MPLQTNRLLLQFARIERPDSEGGANGGCMMRSNDIHHRPLPEKLGAA